MQQPIKNLSTQEILEKVLKYDHKQRIPTQIMNISVKILSHLPRSLLFPLIATGKCTVEYIQGKYYLSKWYYLFPSGKKLNTQDTHAAQSIIISFTTIPSRIRYVPYMLGSLMRQTKKPDKIILYLDEKRFSNKKLPFFLKLYQKHGVEIVCCEDIKAHTKYYHAMTAYPNDIIITVDDDIFYPEDLVETLYASYLKYPTAVSCRRAHLMMFDEKNQIKPYEEWQGEYNRLIDTPSMFLFATGVGGVLYPPHCLPNETFQKRLIHDLSYKADDVWLKFMEILGGTPVVITREYSPDHSVNPGKLQKVALCKLNVSEGENDIQIQNCLKYYEGELEGDLYNTLSSLQKKIMGELENQ